MGKPAVWNECPYDIYATNCYNQIEKIPDATDITYVCPSSTWQIFIPNNFDKHFDPNLLKINSILIIILKPRFIKMSSNDNFKGWNFDDLIYMTRVRSITTDYDLLKLCITAENVHSMISNSYNSKLIVELINRLSNEETSLEVKRGYSKIIDYIVSSKIRIDSKNPNSDISKIKTALEKSSLFKCSAKSKEDKMLCVDTFPTNIEKIIFNNPATIVYWSDGSKTVVKACSEETFSKEHGLAMAIARRYFNNNRCEFKRAIREAYDATEE